MRVGIPLKKLLSERGKKLAVVGTDKYRGNGYRHCDGSPKWRCSTVKSCCAFMYSDVDENHVIGWSGRHKHHSLTESPTKILKHELRENCKRRADELETSTSSKIIKAEMLKLSGTETVEDKTIKSIRKAMYDKRNRRMPAPPKSFEEAVQLARTSKLDRRFMFENQQFVHVHKDLICLTTANNISFLCKHITELFAETTTAYAPKHFEQMYMLYGVKNGTYTPLVYFILDKLTEKTLKDVWVYLKELCIQFSNDKKFNLKYLHVNFEMDKHQTAKTFFPDVKILGPVYSFENNWQQKVRKLCRFFFFNSLNRF